MPAAPQNPRAPFTAASMTKFATWMSTEGGVAPDEEDDDPTFQPLVISRTAGGKTLDYCTFQVELARREQRLIDMETPTGWNRQIEVRVLSTEPPKKDDDGNPIDNSDPIFWGMLGTQTLRIGDRGRTEAASVVARVDRHLYGYPLVSMMVRDPRTTNLARIHCDPFFNPLVNGVIWYNRSTHKNPVGDHYVWVHPESVKTNLAATYQGETARAEWTLSDMVHSICGFLNPNETYIKNPTPADLKSSITDKDPPGVANFYLKRGLWLPQCLDAMLEPHGFGWFLKISRGENGNSIRKIAIFKRGEGEEKQVYLQRPNDSDPAILKLSMSTVKDLTHECSVVDLANKIEAYGAYQEREITLELYRGWAESEDGLFPEQLDKTDPLSDYQTHQNAHRLWVGNEAGDWKGFRPEIGDPRDLSSVFTLIVAQRRRMDDCLQTDVNGRRIPVHAEWWDPAPPDGSAAAWKVIPPGSYSVLTDQIGIRFNGAMPPDDITTAGPDVKIRITGTVTGDSRLFKEATRRDESPNGQDVTLVLDVANRFFDRQVQATGPYASALNDNPNYSTDERDDAEDLQDYVNTVQKVEDAANIRTSIVLHGIHREYEIGDLITKVNGRNISFNRLSKAASEKRYLQVVGIEFERTDQETILRVEINEDEGYELDSSFGGPFGKKLRISG